MMVRTMRLADVTALIDLARIINTKQPKLFSFLLNIMTSKAKIGELVNGNQPFVYTSGKFDSEFEKTSVVAKLVEHPKRQASLVFDLRYDIDDYVNLSVDELAKAWRPEDKDQPKLPIKDILFNRCPAIAPLSVLDEASQKRIGLSIEQIELNYKKFQKVKIDFSKKILQVLNKLDTAQDAEYSKRSKTVDSQLYDGFFGDGDKKAMTTVRSTSPTDLTIDLVKSADKRLKEMLPLYKARNYPKLLSSEEMTKWEEYRNDYLLSGNENSRLSIFFKQLDELSKDTSLDKNKQFLVDELKLYGESIIPSTDF